MKRRTLEDLKSMLSGRRRILVVACEAGAAQILSSMLARIPVSEAIYALEGPAVSIFHQKLPATPQPLSENLVRQSDIVVTGTSLLPELERTAIALSKKERKPVFSILDHWVHYRERFLPEAGKNRSELGPYLPNEIWVTDDDAYSLALSSGIPGDSLVEIDNFYLQDLEARINDLPRYPHTKGTILYISEPVRDDLQVMKGDGRIWGYDEYDLVRNLLDSLKGLERRVKRLIFRLHPNETSDKYEALLRAYPGPVEIEITSNRSSSIEADCLRAEAVLGGESMALIVAILCKKKVFSCLPPQATKRCSLPHKQIVHIRSASEIAPFLENNHEEIRCN